MARRSCSLPVRAGAALGKQGLSRPDMDRTVSIRKFEAEIWALQTEAAGYVSAKGWKIVESTYPVLAVILRHSRSTREIEFRFTCDEWDELPPSLSLCHPNGGGELTWEEWPKDGWDVHQIHTTTGKPFLCLPGLREYHTHQSHLGNKWENYRLLRTYRLRDIVDRVQQRFEDTNG